MSLMIGSGGSQTMLLGVYEGDMLRRCRANLHTVNSSTQCAGMLMQAWIGFESGCLGPFVDVRGTLLLLLCWWPVVWSGAGACGCASQPCVLC